MLIDCTTCVARDIACADCVVTVLLSSPPPVARPPVAAPVAAPAEATVGSGAALDLDESERSALGMLAQAGLVPPLRLVRPIAPGRELSDTA